MSRRAAPAPLAFVFLLAFAACSSGPNPQSGCSPPCTAGTRCDENSGTCVADETLDLSISPDLLPATGCSPPCAAPTPFCNASHRCVPCLTDDDCPVGKVCKAFNGDATMCTDGCQDDSRCRGDGGAGGSCCGGQCIDTNRDVANCGACGVACKAIHAQPACVGGACQPGACDSGWGNCNADPGDGCETNLRIDPSNCTACGKPCQFVNGIGSCSDGCYLAACNFGFDDCNGDPTDGCEQDVTSDMKNCGGCGNPCTNKPHAKNTCTASSCILTSCDLGYSDCNQESTDGCEVATGTDVKNCGRCGNACPQGLVCVNASCTCPQCNFPNAKSKCVNNVCTFDTCLPGYADCDKVQANGCEVSLNNDAKNCGACGNACPMNTPFCTNAMCALINTKVMIVYAAQQSWAQDIQMKLQGTGDFLLVDLFAAGAGTPSLQQLTPYGAILVFSDSGFADADGLGNVVADYYDGGGQVVIATFANASVPIRGRFGAIGNGYMLINPAGQEQPNDALGTIDEPQSPLVAGVAQFSATAAYRSSGAAVNGGIVVAEWRSGKPLVVRGTVKGRNRADLNFFPPSSQSRNDFWTGDGTRLMRNALLYR